MVECVLCTYKVVGSIPTISIFLFMTYILRTYVKKKYLIHSLMTVYGIGLFQSKQICKALGFQYNFLLKNVTDEQTFQISQYVEELKLPIKGELQRWWKQKVDGLVAIKIQRGIRHRQGLPVRGQRTHTNARTQKRLKHLKK
jgi:small subunit ribosomal protein S13